jgi:hypothetical protein
VCHTDPPRVVFGKFQMCKLISIHDHCECSSHQARYLRVVTKKKKRLVWRKVSSETPFRWNVWPVGYSNPTYKSMRTAYKKMALRIYGCKGWAEDSPVGVFYIVVTWFQVALKRSGWTFERTYMSYLMLRRYRKVPKFDMGWTDVTYVNGNQAERVLWIKIINHTTRRLSER